MCKYIDAPPVAQEEWNPSPPKTGHLKSAQCKPVRTSSSGALTIKVKTTADDLEETPRVYLWVAPKKKARARRKTLSSEFGDRRAVGMFLHMRKEREKQAD